MLVTSSAEADHPSLLTLLGEVNRRLTASFAQPPAVSKDDVEERQALQTALVALVQVCARD